MDIGRRIYFDKATGQVIVDTGERTGSVKNTTVEQDFESWIELSKRVKDTVGLLELEYGQYVDDFAQTDGFRINPDTLTLEFSYPDPNAPEEPPVYQPPLTEQVSQLQSADLDNKEAIASLFEMVLTGTGV